MVMPRAYQVLPLALLAGVGAIALWTSQPLAFGDGADNRTLTGCTCHNELPTPTVTVQISGPTSVLPGSTHSYTLSVAGGPAGTTGGFNVIANKGTFTAGAFSQLVLPGELTHSDNAVRSWTFDWTAPATEGPAEWTAVALSSNGSSNNGDAWNFYGGASGTPFTIQVTSGVDVAPLPALITLSPAAPNPTRGSTGLDFTLAQPGTAQLTVFDARGRRIATLAEGSFPAGTHRAAWDGRRADGALAASGVYVVRLSAAGMERTTRVHLLH